MSEFDEKLLNRLHLVEREIERLKRWEHKSKTEFDAEYLGLTAQAADSHKVDGLHAAAAGANAHVLATDANGNAFVNGNVDIGSSLSGQQTGSEAVYHTITFQNETYDVVAIKATKTVGSYGDAGELGLYTANGSLVEAMRITSVGNVWMVANCSALSFTDRTPFYEGDALSEIRTIKGIDGKIDHKTLPTFARVEREVIVEPAVEAKGKVKAKPAVTEIQQERDLGAMISMMTVAIQQLSAKVEELEKKNKA